MAKRVIGEGADFKDCQPGDVVVFGGNPVTAEEDTRLIVVTQLPVIKERLKVISEKIKQDTAAVLAMDVNEETVKQAKAIRAEMNKAFTQLEDERKRVKNEVAAPFLALEITYKDLISVPFKDADAALKVKIDSVEDGLKAEKISALDDYFREYAASVNVDFIELSDAKINVTLTASMKSLREQAKAFIDKVAEDVAMIMTLSNADEVMAEYLIDLNASKAIKTIKDRHDAIAAQQAERERRDAVQAQQRTAAVKVEQIAIETAPVVLPPVATADSAEEEFTVDFSVTATRDMLIALKKFLQEGGYKFE